MNEMCITAEENAPALSSSCTDVLIHTPSCKKICVIGAGPAGIRFCAELLKRDPLADITVFGNEPYAPYNRVQLSSLLAGDISYEEITTPLPSPHKHPNFHLYVCTIHGIDHANKILTDSHNNPYHYDKLVIATGSRPHVPNILGTEKEGVYTFRSLKDAESLYSRTSRARHIVVVGGGLLGIESAKALARLNTQVTLVQQGPRLMNRQLDDEAAGKLEHLLREQGITIITDSGVREILGNGRVAGVITRDKTHIVCDTVLLCAGIKPNIEIARAAKIIVGKGIIVDDQLQTSANDVYAIGECSEHRGALYGLANPGFEQAAVLANNLHNDRNPCPAQYLGSLEISRLKVIGAPICSMGEIADLTKHPFQNEFKYRHKKNKLYRKIVTRKGRLIGAVSFGDWDETRRVQEAYQTNRRIWPWQVIRFLATGKLFSSTNDNINLWPRSAIVCQCNAITQGELIDALASGKDSLTRLQESTKAGTVCGSCKPLLLSLVGSNAAAEKEKAWFTTLAVSIMVLIIGAAIIGLPEMQISNSVQNPNFLENIWNDKFWKQVTGFSLLGMSALGLLMSLRKKMTLFKFGDYAWWRLLHIILGLACVIVLILHTGFHLGSNFNQILMFNFIGVLTMGSVAGALISLNHKMSASYSHKLRKLWIWIHILLTWPLPALIGFHILTVYYF